MSGKSKKLNVFILLLFFINSNYFEVEGTLKRDKKKVKYF